MYIHIYIYLPHITRHHVIEEKNERQKRDKGKKCTQLYMTCDQSSHVKEHFRGRGRSFSTPKILSMFLSRAFLLPFNASLLHPVPSPNSFVRYCPSSSITGTQTIKLLDDLQRRSRAPFRNSSQICRSSGTQSICRSVLRTSRNAPIDRRLTDSPMGFPIADRCSNCRCTRGSVHTRNAHTRRSCGRKVFPGIFTRRLLGRGQGETLRWDVISVDKAASSTLARCN